ncbi:MAG: DUF2975 domain-containing protein [Clostridia bacterium]|nr:DUF2975 domain-containing protein [Clostridia bacterium]
MNQKKLSLWLKAVIIVVGICGLVVYFGILPNIGDAFHTQFPEFAAWHLPWLIFLWCTAIPCYAVLVLGWKIAVRIGEDRSFSPENAKLLQYIAWLVAGDILFFFVGNAVFFFLSMNHPGILLISLLICVIGIAVAIAAACLSHLVRKAADLQEQSDLTV